MVKSSTNEAIAGRARAAKPTLRPNKDALAQSSLEARFRAAHPDQNIPESVAYVMREADAVFFEDIVFWPNSESTEGRGCAAAVKVRQPLLYDSVPRYKELQSLILKVNCEGGEVFNIVVHSRSNRIVDYEKILGLLRDHFLGTNPTSVEREEDIEEKFGLISGQVQPLTLPPVYTINDTEETAQILHIFDSDLTKQYDSVARMTTNAGNHEWGCEMNVQKLIDRFKSMNGDLVLVADVVEGGPSVLLGNIDPLVKKSGIGVIVNGRGIIRGLLKTCLHRQLAQLKEIKYDSDGPNGEEALIHAPLYSMPAMSTLERSALDGVVSNIVLYREMLIDASTDLVVDFHRLGVRYLVSDCNILLRLLEPCLNATRFPIYRQGDPDPETGKQLTWSRVVHLEGDNKDRALMDARMMSKHGITFDQLSRGLSYISKADAVREAVEEEVRTGKLKKLIIFSGASVAASDHPYVQDLSGIDGLELVTLDPEDAASIEAVMGVVENDFVRTGDTNQKFNEANVHLFEILSAFKQEDGLAVLLASSSLSYLYHEQGQKLLSKSAIPRLRQIDSSVDKNLIRKLNGIRILDSSAIYAQYVADKTLPVS